MAVKIQTIKDIRLYLEEELKTLFPEQEIRAIISVINKTLFRNSGLHAHMFANTPATEEQASRAVMICDELKTGKPIQYILGETDFYNCTIKVNSNVMIPRPETEELVDIIVSENKGFKGDILDAGTGSGCISVALARGLPGSDVHGFDLSEAALELAEKNARLNNVKVDFFMADIFTLPVKKCSGTDILVSNPPYIRESEKKSMKKNVLGFEPSSALFVTDTDPLKFYRSLAETGRRILSPGGKIYFEINEALGSETVRLINKKGYSAVELIRDINGKDRFIKASMND